MYRKVDTLQIICGQTGILASAAVGGLLFSAHPGVPFITEAIDGIACFILITLINEQHKTDHVAPTWSHRQHFVQSMKHLFATKYLRVTVCMGVIFSVMLGMCIQFVHEAAMIERGFGPEARGFLISGAGV